MSPTKNTLPMILTALWTMQSAIVVAGEPLTNTIADDSAMYDPNLFEGDIEITTEEFEKYYGVPHTDQAGNVSNPLNLKIVLVDCTSLSQCTLITSSSCITRQLISVLRNSFTW